MAATKEDILGLVLNTVKLLIHGTGKVPDVVLDGDNILIWGKPVPIADIEATTHSAKGFLKLVRGAM